MKPFRLNGQHIAIGAQLALMAIISYALVTKTHQPDTDQATDIKVAVVDTTPAPVTKVAVRAPFAKPVIQSVAVKPVALDLAIKALTPRDAALYRALFTAHDKGQWERAETLIRRIKDRRLMGIALADRFKKLGATLAEKKAWLEHFPDLPQAKNIHAAAVKQGGKDLRTPRKLKKWSGGFVADSATSFNAEQNLRKAAKTSKNRTLARQIRSKISRGQPTLALKLLHRAEKKRALSDSFIGQAQALISASYFRSGNIEKAKDLSNKAARADQPLGTWIRGLVAWQQKQYGAAHVLFTRLAARNDLSNSNDAAAHFWAYRAADKTGHNQQGQMHLEKAAAHTKAMYGLLAGHLLDKNPITQARSQKLKWSDKHRNVLAKIPAGWRALALIQIGQNKRAQAELRHINPQGNRKKREAMLALTSIAPMPALTLKLATLKRKKDYNPNFYPILPWEPKGGFEIDRALLYALARQESRFNPTAVSSRGARGLMQIMPATARYVAKKNNLKAPYYKRESLFDPSMNMTVGQKYVRQLSKLPHIGNNLVLILAAYNAGPGNALNWIERQDTSDPLLFLESIPTRETRQYVARVLPHYWAYRAQFGKPLGSLKQLSNGEWPTASLDATSTLRVADASGQ